MIDWDGIHLPKELQQLPPGRYLVSDPYLDDGEMSEEEEAAVMHGLDQADAGQTVPLEDAIQRIRSRAIRK